MPTITGTEQGDVLYDTSGNDSISALGGDDVIADFFGGMDGIDGGAGRDLLVFNMDYTSGGGGRGDFTMMLSQGGSTIAGSAAWKSNFLSFINIEDVSIYFRDTANHAIFNDIVNTGDGNDSVFDNVGGNDQYNLGGGIDLLEYSFTGSGAAVMTISGQDANGYNGSGTATGSSIAFTGVDIFHITGTAQGDTLVGGQNADILMGMAGNDDLRGFGGDDAIYGGDGNDLIFGGDGNDDLGGGAGNDEIHGGNGDDTIGGQGGTDALYGEDGNDLIYGSGLLDGGPGDDRLYVSSGVADGGDGADTLVGSGGANTLNGDAGDDDLWLTAVYASNFANGGAGNDRLHLDMIIDFGNLVNGDFNVDPNGGYQGTFLITDAPGNRVITFSGIENFSIVGGDQSTTIHTGDGNDTFAMAGGNDTVDARGGDDVIDGGPGADTMIGGAGDDTYFVDNVGDQVIEQAGEGNDTIVVNPGLASYSLSALPNVENLTGQSTTGQRLTGNSGDNVITGGSGDDAIIGLGGHDILIGGAGNDAYILADGLSTIVEAPGGGNDTVYVTTSYALNSGAEVETLSVYDRTTTDPLAISGNEFGQAIYGNAGDNALVGGGGADVMYGLAGNDAYLVDSLDDQVIEAVGGGNDTVYASGSFVLTASSEIEVLSVYDRSTTNAINLAGNEFAQTIYGNAGNNFIDGKGGSDTIYLMGGTDTVVFSTPLGANNVDTINGFTSGDDKLWLDSVTFAGLTPGALNANAFFAGSAAHDADDRIVYDSTTGNLYFDADGNGAGAAVQFAHVDPGTIIAAGDFTII